MERIGQIIAYLSVPIMLLNMFGGIIAGIWLAFLGEWRLIFLGLALICTAHWVIGLLMLPGLLILPLAAYLGQRKSPLVYLVGAASQFYTNLLMVGTCAAAFYVCTSYYGGQSKLGLLPYVLWSWGMALGPWQFLASKEQDNEFTMLTLLSASILYFLFLLSIFIHPFLTLVMIVLFLVTQLIAIPILNMYIASKTG